jgi:hypothetical protein
LIEIHIRAIIIASSSVMSMGIMSSTRIPLMIFTLPGY